MSSCWEVCAETVTSYESRKGQKVSGKRWKKMTRTPLNSKKSWTARRRGSYVAYYVRNESAIRAEGQVHNISVDMKKWIDMCLGAAEDDVAPIPAVLACVMDVLLVDLDAQTNF